MSLCSISDDNARLVRLGRLGGASASRLRDMRVAAVSLRERVLLQPPVQRVKSIHGGFVPASSKFCQYNRLAPWFDSINMNSIRRPGSTIEAKVDFQFIRRGSVVVVGEMIAREELLTSAVTVV